MLGNRSMQQIINSIFGKQHYIALANMALTYPDFAKNLARYLSASGSYPYNIKIKTPLGTIEPTLYSHHDLLTVNEIFCRQDYNTKNTIKTVIDIGSNIGISALFFLTRNPQVKCYLYEPDPRNIIKLRENLTNYADRYFIHENAVADFNGSIEFGIDTTGRYGGIGIASSDKIIVNCVDINLVMSTALEKNEFIDILKIDTEGVEIKTVLAIKEAYLKQIRSIHIEAKPDKKIFPHIFKQRQYGSVCQLTNMHI